MLLTYSNIQKENDPFISVGASTSAIETFSNIGSIMISLEWPHYLALLVLLLLVVFGYCRGRSHSLAWSNIPLIALAILSIGPSVCAVILYLAYKFGLVQPGASDDFAVPSPRVSALTRVRVLFVAACQGAPLLRCECFCWFSRHIGDRPSVACSVRLSEHSSLRGILDHAISR